MPAVDVGKGVRDQRPPAALVQVAARHDHVVVELAHGDPRALGMRDAGEEGVGRHARGHLAAVEEDARADGDGAANDEVGFAHRVGIHAGAGGAGSTSVLGGGCVEASSWMELSRGVTCRSRESCVRGAARCRGLEALIDKGAR